MKREDLLKKVLSMIVVILLLVAAWWAGRAFFSDEARIQAFFQQFPFACCNPIVFVFQIQY